MRCPSCLASLIDSSEECLSCGFSLTNLGKKFGTVPHNFKVSDYGGAFQGQEIERLERILRKTENRFENLHLSVMTLEIAPQFKAREYVFWLMNRCNFSPLEARLGQNFSAVLVIDVTSRNVALTTGYGLQSALSEERLEQILDLGLPYLRRDKAYQGCVVMVREIERQLQRFTIGKQTPLPKKTHAPSTNLKPVEDLF